MTRWTRTLVILTLVIALYGGMGVMAGQQAHQSNDPPAGGQGAQTTPPYHKSAEDAKPLPRLLPATDFIDHPLVVKAYAIAHQIPLVLGQQPCYCHCDKEFGHSSLLDCFASAHTAGCGVCMAETFLAYEMTKQGKTPSEIRAAIIRGDWKRPVADKSAN